MGWERWQGGCRICSLVPDKARGRPDWLWGRGKTTGPVGSMLCFRSLQGKFEFLCIDLTSSKDLLAPNIPPRRREIDGWVICSKTPADDCWHQQISFLETAFQYSGHSGWLFINSGVTRKQHASKCDQLRNKLRCEPVSVSVCVCVWKESSEMF